MVNRHAINLLNEYLIKQKQAFHLRKDGKGGYSVNIQVSRFTNHFENASIAIKVEASNDFYRLDQEYNYRLMELLTPAAVRDLKIMEELTTFSSIIATFALPKALENISQALLFDVRWKLAENKSDEWREILNPRLQIRGREGYLVLDSLEYANTDYSMKIRIKSKLANDVDDMWSTFKEISFKTNPKLPETLPNICENCFNVMDNGNVVVYWTEVPKLYQNADNFTYLIRGWNEANREIIHEDLIGNSLILDKISTTNSVRIELFSKNSLGVSQKFNQISIRREHFHSNRKLLKIRKQLINSEYQISWKLIEGITDVKSFTVIWCQQRNEIPNQCDGPVKYENLPPDAFKFDLHASTSYQFGIAANLRNQSLMQGFEWAECTAAKDNGEYSAFNDTIN